MRQQLFPAGTTTPAEEAVIAAKILPGGFGGLYQDLVRHSLVVGLVDPAASSEALLVLTELLRCGGIYRGWLGTRLSLGAVEVRTAAFRADSLWAWLMRLQELGLASEAWATEIDPATNRVWIGVASQDRINAIRAAVAAGAVPASAIVVEPPPPGDAPGPMHVLSLIVTAEERPSIGWEFEVVLEHTNREPFPVYQDRCVMPIVEPLRSEPQYRLEKWDGTAWRSIFRPVCSPILLSPPISVPSGGSRPDTVRVLATYRLQAEPVWDNSRVAGYYRFVVSLFRSAGGQPPQLIDPFPDEYNRTPPFRLRPRYRP